MSDLENMSDEEKNRLAATMNSLLRDPALRKQTLSLVKQKNPGVTIPEIDQEEALQKLRDEQAEKINELNAMV